MSLQHKSLSPIRNQQPTFSTVTSTPPHHACLLSSIWRPMGTRHAQIQSKSLIAILWEQRATGRRSTYSAIVFQAWTIRSIATVRGTGYWPSSQFSLYHTLGFRLTCPKTYDCKRSKASLVVKRDWRRKGGRPICLCEMARRSTTRR